MKTFILSSAFVILLASSATGTAADCYRTDPAQLPSMPAGVKPVANGYHCVDHRGAYVEVKGGELVIPVRGWPRVKPRPAGREIDLFEAGMSHLPNGLRRAGS